MRRRVGLAMIFEIRAPHVLRFAEHRAHEVDLGVFRLAADRRSRRLGGHALIAATVQQAEHGRRADAQKIADADYHQGADDTEVYAAEAASRTTVILDIIAAAAVIKLHRGTPGGR